MMPDLPELSPKSLDEVKRFATHVFSRGDTNYLVAVQEKPHNLFHVIFDSSYFMLQPGNDEPSKSQWNTLKKHIKRLNSQVFVSKFHGKQDNNYYVEIGYFSN